MAGPWGSWGAWALVGAGAFAVGAVAVAAARGTAPARPPGGFGGFAPPASRPATPASPPDTRAPPVVEPVYSAPPLYQAPPVPPRGACPPAAPLADVSNRMREAYVQGYDMLERTADAFGTLERNPSLRILQVELNAMLPTSACQTRNDGTWDASTAAALADFYELGYAGPALSTAEIAGLRQSSRAAMLADPAKRAALPYLGRHVHDAYRVLFPEQ